VDYAEDRRTAAGGEGDVVPPPRHTTMLSQDELTRLLEQQQHKEKTQPDLKLVQETAAGKTKTEGSARAPRTWWVRPEFWTAFLLGLMLGLILGRWV